MKKIKRKAKIILYLLFFTGLVYFGQSLVNGKQEIFSRKNNFEFKNTGDASANDTTSENGAKNDELSGKNENSTKSRLTGEPCENPTRRSFAVMLATDRETRPLSGISYADMVFEMPVITDGATRLMAVFGCTVPKEIGSVRSARHDFIDLAKSVDAIYAHWGGSHFALDKLKIGTTSDIDALANPYDAYFRKRGIPAPHNGFTSGEGLLYAAEKLGFRMENKFEGYPHEESQISKIKSQKSGKLTIGYPGEFKAEYRYDPATNFYLRWRGGTKEIDKNNGDQVKAENIAVMYAESKQIEGDYNDVALEGEGAAEFYLNGEKIDGIWKKAADPNAKLYFLNKSGEEIKFTPGNIWVEVVQTNQKVEWKE